MAVRNSGGKVHGFSHGEPIVYDWDKISWMELSLNDYYYEYTTKIAEELSFEIIKNPPPNNNKYELKSFNTAIFKNRSLKNYKKKIKIIMILGNSYQDIGYSAVTSILSSIQLHLEYSLAKIVLENNYDVVYKPHPGLYFANKEITFMPKEVEIVYDPFENIMDKADAFLFYYTRTTVFGPALCTNKQIIFIDGGWEIINKNMLKLLEKRCRFVSAKFDKRNVLEVNKKELENALALIEAEIDTLFYEKYLN